MKSKIIIIVLLLIGFINPACSSNIESYKKDAKSLCDVYNPENWKEYIKVNGTENIYSEIGVRSREAIKTEEFRNIFAKFLDERQTNLHDYIHKQVSQLIGEEWQCAYFDNFETPVKRKEIQISIKGVKEVVPQQNGREILVTIDASGKYYVNSMPLINNEEATLLQALKMTAKKTKPKIVIQADEQAPNGALLTAIYVAGELGLNSVSLEVH